ncbi:MAG: phosphatidylglycerophosphatase A [Acidobacteriia bacterium]|nr:phosphatidylglycerophosphatase A [Terriglobia bacterium]
MNPNTDTPATDAPPSEVPEAAPRKKPRLALALATGLGVGYAPKAPGTFGSIVGVALTVCVLHLGWRLSSLLDSGVIPGFRNQPSSALPFVFLPSLVLLLVAGIGVWSAARVAKYAGIEDPQSVVIDEVSGQHLALLLGGGPFALLHWKTLLLGFILFRVFDIWKPFPARQLEKLPGGWGIMADDWMAAVYAALVLRLVLHLGLI